MENCGGGLVAGGTFLVIKNVASVALKIP